MRDDRQFVKLVSILTTVYMIMFASAERIVLVLGIGLGYVNYLCMNCIRAIIFKKQETTGIMAYFKNEHCSERDRDLSMLLLGIDVIFIVGVLLVLICGCSNNNKNNNNGSFGYDNRYGYTTTLRYKSY